MKKPELLIPAGGLETLKVAVDYGADAVYIGGNRFGLRAKADNFTHDEMKEAVSYTHSHDVKLYVTTNIYAHNEDIEKAEAYFEELRDLGVDAVLISDPGMFSIASKVLDNSDTEIHISTQANNTNYMTYRFWHDMGATRVVAARELSLKEIKDIRNNIPESLEIEAFIHGAMCISYSGRCLLSNYFTGRDANRGACTHPCRWKYAVVEENRPGEYLPVEEDERGTYIFNSKDLCMVDKIPDLIDAGIDSFKVEGRMKTNLYVATTARTYREAIDDYFESPELYKSKIEHYKREISMCTMRDFTRGFYYGKPSEEDQIYDNNTYMQNAVYMGRVEKINEDGSIEIYQKNKFSVGDVLEIMLYSGDNLSIQITDIIDEYGNAQSSAPHPKQKLKVFYKNVAIDGSKKVSSGMVLRSIV
ncbi:MAG: U32 family peptidase [Eubacterium sp.]|nr:U32 family peptidase [Eubacterium sp.]